MVSHVSTVEAVTGCCCLSLRIVTAMRQSPGEVASTAILFFSRSNCRRQLPVKNDAFARFRLHGLADREPQQEKKEICFEVMSS